MRIGALAVLDDLLEIAAQHVRQLVDLPARLVVDRQALHDVLQLVDQLARDCREIVDEIERVLDLVCDPGGELAKRGELLRLHQAILRGAQVLERGGQFARAPLHLVEQAHVLDRDHRLVGEGLDQLDLLVGERPHGFTLQNDHPDGDSFAQQGDSQHRVNTANFCCAGHFEIRVCQDVGNVNDSTLRYRTANDRPAPRRYWMSGHIFL